MMTEMEQILTNQDVFTRLARELKDLSRRSSDLDEALGMALLDSAALFDIPGQLIQDVDYLRQSLECLHIAMENLSGCAKVEEGQVASHVMTKGIYMSAMRDRLLE